jgi:hypothetical protein
MSAAISPLQHWEGEGGAPAMPAVPAALPPRDDASLLAQLGAALVAEWDRLPTAVQRAVYERAVSTDARSDGDAVKREFARFLHDHKQRSVPA